MYQIRKRAYWEVYIVYKLVRIFNSRKEAIRYINDNRSLFI